MKSAIAVTRKGGRRWVNAPNAASDDQSKMASNAGSKVNFFIRKS